jgi:hypothetical protein
MERFYDGDQEKLFAEAHVINPFRKGPVISRNRSSQNLMVSQKFSLSSILFILLRNNVFLIKVYKLHFLTNRFLFHDLMIINWHLFGIK